MWVFGSFSMRRDFFTKHQTADLPHLPTELPPIGRELTLWAPSKCLRASYLRVYLVVDLMLLLVIGREA